MDFLKALSDHDIAPCTDEWMWGFRKIDAQSLSSSVNKTDCLFAFFREFFQVAPT